MAGQRAMASKASVESPSELETADLAVYLLGPPLVEWAGRPLAIPRRQTRALLYYLATHLSPFPRECLCWLFWPDTPESTAHRDLSHLLTHLRRALPGPDVLLTTDDCITLDARRAWSDTVTFERLLRNSGEPRHSVEAQRQAVDLYRGSFLAGFSLPSGPEFETWATLERCTWERCYLEALAALVEGHMACGDYPAAIDYARRYLAVDDLNEEMHRCLIELYAAVGDWGGATRQFEQCTVTLERELGISPVPETRAAYQMAVSGRPSPPRIETPPPTWTTLPSLEAPLIGRAEALRHLREAYEDARLGRGRLVLISGQPGIGKTRLMQHFVTGLADEASVVVGAGHEAERAMPYWPLVEALRPYLRVAFEGASDLAPAYLAELARLWPELHSMRPDLPQAPYLELCQAQARLFHALTCLLLELAARRPALVLCLDNLHWADEGTLTWLGYLARHLGHAPLMVLGTYRGEEGQVLGPLREELERSGLLQEVRLGGLSQAEVLSLIRCLSGQQDGAQRFSQRLHQVTGGNPFYVLETLRVMFEAGTLWRDETGWITGADKTAADYRELPLPDTVCEAIRARLRRLSPQALQVLESGVVLGLRFSFDLALAVSGRRRTETVEALDELLARQVITECDNTYVFEHSLIQRVAYGDLSYGRRRLLHRRAGEALEKTHPGEMAALARHFEQAEELGLAAHYALQAGLAAKDLFAQAEARAFFDRALACLEREAAHLHGPEARSANRRLRVQVLAERGWAFRLLGEMDAYARDLQEVARLAGLLGDQRTLAHLHWREACSQRWFCRYPDALESAQEGARLSQAAQDLRLEALCWREVGMAARATGDYGQAGVALERALSLFAELGEAVYEIHTLGNLSTLHCCRGEYEQATALARQALGRCEAAGLTLERRLPLGDLGAAAAALGELELAEGCLSESLAIACQVADRTQEILCLGHLGWLRLRLEQPDPALDLLHEALGIAEGINSQAERSWLWSGVAEAHRLVGDLELAADDTCRALALAQASGRVYDQELARGILEGLGQADL